MKKIGIGICIIICISTQLIGCRQIIYEPLGISESINAVNPEITEDSLYEITDADNYTGSNQAITIALNELENNLKTQEYEYVNNYLSIMEPGEYILTGRLSNGRIIVDVDEDEVVQLIFSNVEIESEDDAPIFVKNAAKLIITIEKGTKNMVTDSAYSRDCIKILGTNIVTQVINNGIRGNDGVLIFESGIDIESEGSGIVSPDEKGYVIVKDSNVKVIAGENAILSKQYVLVDNCETDLYSVKERINCDGITEAELE